MLGCVPLPCPDRSVAEPDATNTDKTSHFCTRFLCQDTEGLAQLIDLEAIAVHCRNPTVKTHLHLPSDGLQTHLRRGDRLKYAWTTVIVRAPSLCVPRPALLTCYAGYGDAVPRFYGNGLSWDRAPW